MIRPYHRRRLPSLWRRLLVSWRLKVRSRSSSMMQLIRAKHKLSRIKEAGGDRPGLNKRTRRMVMTQCRARMTWTTMFTRMKSQALMCLTMISTSTMLLTSIGSHKSTWSGYRIYNKDNEYQDRELRWCCNDRNEELRDREPNFQRGGSLMKLLFKMTSIIKVKLILICQIKQFNLCRYRSKQSARAPTGTEVKNLHE